MMDDQQFMTIEEEDAGHDSTKAPSKRPSSIGVSRPQIRNPRSLYRPPSTPNTFISLGDALIKPDLTLHCQECDIYIEMCHLLPHRQVHRAMKTLHYTVQDLPQKSSEITDRRTKLITDMDCANKDIDRIRELNEAQDILRAYVEKTMETTRQFDDAKIQDFVTGSGLDCSCDCVLSVGICSDQNGRYRSVMEDRKVYQDFFGNDDGKAFLGLYDGYHGCFAAEVAANEIHHVLLQELIRFDPKTSCTCTVNMITDEASSDYDQNRPYTVNSERVALHYESTNMVQSIIHTCEKNLASVDSNFKEPKSETSPFSSLMSTAFVKSYNEVDHYLSYGMDEHSRVRWSGCSALTILLKDSEEGSEVESESDEPKAKKLGDIHIAQAGEVRAVLVRNGKVHSLSKDHSLSNNKERNRVIKNGGTVTGQKKNAQRINGVISSTRGLGSHGDPKLKRCIRVDPHTRTVTVDEYAEFMILASRGVWEIFSDDEAAKIVGQVLPRNLCPPPSRVSTSLRSVLNIPQSRSSTALDLDLASGDIDPNSDDLDPDSKVQETEKIDSEKEDGKDTTFDQDDPGISRPNTGKSSRVSFNPNDEIVQIEDRRSLSFMMPELELGQLRRDFAKEMAERLTHAALMAGAKDNITVMVVLFPGSGL